MPPTQEFGLKAIMTPFTGLTLDMVGSIFQPVTNSANPHAYARDLHNRGLGNKELLKASLLVTMGVRPETVAPTSQPRSLPGIMLGYDWMVTWINLPLDQPFKLYDFLAKAMVETTFSIVRSSFGQDVDFADYDWLLMHYGLVPDRVNPRQFLPQEMLHPLMQYNLHHYSETFGDLIESNAESVFQVRENFKTAISGERECSSECVLNAIDEAEKETQKLVAAGYVGFEKYLSVRNECLHENTASPLRALNVATEVEIHRFSKQVGWPLPMFDKSFQGGQIKRWGLWLLDHDKVEMFTFRRPKDNESLTFVGASFYKRKEKEYWAITLEPDFQDGEPPPMVRIGSPAEAKDKLMRHLFREG